MNRTLLATAIAALGAAACAKPPPVEPVVQIREVFVPVAKACVPNNLPETPDWRVTGDTVRRAPTPEDRYIAAAAGMKERDDRLKAVEPVIKKCR